MNAIPDDRFKYLFFDSEPEQRKLASELYTLAGQVLYSANMVTDAAVMMVELAVGLARKAYRLEV